MQIRLFAALLLAAATLAAPMAVAQDGESDNLPYGWLLSEKAKSVVTIKFVLKMQITMMGQTQDSEQNSEVRGTLVNDSGLVLTSSSHFEGGIPPAYRRMLGDQVEIKGSPSEIKVLFGNEVEEYDAQLVARDSTLDLAFVQIMDLKDRETVHVDLNSGLLPKIGQELVGITRRARGFDCAPRIARMFVSSLLEKPRKMWAVDGDFDALSHPVFNRAGQVVGVLSIQEGSEGVSNDEGGLLGGGGMAENILPVIIPLSDVVRSLKGAESRAAEAIAAAAGGGDDEDAPEGDDDDAEHGDDDDGEEHGDGDDDDGGEDHGDDD